MKAYFLLWKFIRASRKERECDFMQDFKGSIFWGGVATEAHNALMKWCKDYSAY